MNLDLKLTNLNANLVSSVFLFFYRKRSFIASMISSFVTSASVNSRAASQNASVVIIPTPFHRMQPRFTFIALLSDGRTILIEVRIMLRVTRREEQAKHTDR